MLRNVFKQLRSLGRSCDHANLKELWNAASLVRPKMIRLVVNLPMLKRFASNQANTYVNSRIRRIGRLYNKYRRTAAWSRLFTESFLNLMIRLSRKREPSMLLLCSAGFSFQKEGVTDEEVVRCMNEFTILKPAACSPTGRQPCDGPSSRLNIDTFGEHLASEGYEQIVHSRNLHIWRKSEEGLANYKYKVCGTFTDIPARAFFAVQCDTEYRKKWDKLVVELKVVQQDLNNDVIYWHMHYPFPMNSRDYVFVRRHFVSNDDGCMVVISHAVEHPDCPVKKGVVRVDQYMSDMVISPHGSFDDNGFDYLLTYYDDPQTSFPSPIYAWMAASGVHDYLDKLHKATKRLHEGSNTVCATQMSRLKDGNIQHSGGPAHLEQFA